MWKFKLRMYLMLAVLFGIVYAVMVILGSATGIGNFYFYAALAAVIMYIQYLVGPKLVEWSMRVRYVGENEHPELQQMVQELSRKAKIPQPRLGIAALSLPNAFAFGRGSRDGRVCVTEGIMSLLDKEELRAVLGHEISHLKNRDVLTITLLSIVPLIMYRLAWHFLFFGGYGRRRNQGGNTILIGLAALIFYFITNLLVLYASRIREYFADRGSILLGNSPSSLASALYKLVYGAARMKKEDIKEAEGLKAFFVSDPSRAAGEIQELAQLDLDKSGTIDSSELATLRGRGLNLGFGDRLLEALSTHPNMLKRIKQLSRYE